MQIFIFRAVFDEIFSHKLKLKLLEIAGVVVKSARV